MWFMGTERSTLGLGLIAWRTRLAGNREGDGRIDPSLVDTEHRPRLMEPTTTGREIRRLGRCWDGQDEAGNEELNTSHPEAYPALMAGQQGGLPNTELRCMFGCQWHKHRSEPSDDYHQSLPLTAAILPRVRHEPLPRLGVHHLPGMWLGEMWLEREA